MLKTSLHWPHALAGVPWSRCLEARQPPHTRYASQGATTTPEKIPTLLILNQSPWLPRVASTNESHLKELPATNDRGSRAQAEGARRAARSTGLRSDKKEKQNKAGPRPGGKDCAHRTSAANLFRLNHGGRQDLCPAPPRPAVAGVSAGKTPHRAPPRPPT
ncbi:hypothetical protein E2C01_040392 [Portunus trituberculatus]|uniref:Uncharacterized protein n=1 Tax=Portunus trituberculatus TaxID=210409 RepID=A0A5B7FME7_PORTR|nr:hypothetical protein [Portunus trituberculatus]